MKNKIFLSKSLARLLCLLALMFVLTGSAINGFAQATIEIVNVDEPNEGFNDPTPRTPIGGNPGTTLGRQRLIAFQFAADIWGATLKSDVPIRVQASFDPLTCTATTAVLGSAGAIQVFRNFPGAEYPNTWYSVALANSRAGFDLSPGAPGTNADDIRARFNSNIGLPGCLVGSDWYYGLDSNQPSNRTSLVTVLLHEFAHGLGFQTFVNSSTGQNLFGFPDVFSRFIYDKDFLRTWPELTVPERQISALNTRRIVWNGPVVTGEVPTVLGVGIPVLTVNAPAEIARSYAVGEASFGSPLTAAGVAGNVVQALDPANAQGLSVSDACSALTNAAAVNGNIAFVDRGTCGFAVKARNVQNAGAIAMIVADNQPGSPPPGLGGVDPAVTIPSIRISQGDGNRIRSRLTAGVNAVIRFDQTIRVGADETNRALLNAPDPIQPGSSISHWDPIASPNQLMEPVINNDLRLSVRSPQDLTVSLFRDIGWTEAPLSDLTVSQRVTDGQFNQLPAPVGAGEYVRFVTRVTNAGEGPANNVEPRLNLPTGAAYKLISVGVLGTSGQVTGFGGQAGTIFAPVLEGGRATFRGNLGAGASVDLSVLVIPTGSGVLTSRGATVDQNNVVSESNESNNTAETVTARIDVDARPDFIVSVEAPAQTRVGQELTYTIKVSNIGNKAAGTNAEFVYPRNLPLEPIRATAPSGWLAYVGDLEETGQAYFQNKGTVIQPGETVILQVVVVPTAAGTLTTYPVRVNTFSISSGGGLEPTENNLSNIVTTIINP